MISLEVRPRIIINTSVNGPVQLSERFFEHPLPKNTHGIIVFNGGRRDIDILDKEIEIYSNSFPGDPVIRRLAAVFSVEDVKILAPQLLAITNLNYAVIPPLLPKQERNFNPDNYPPARIISDPDIVVNNHEIEDIEHPFPYGSEGLRLPLAIRGISPFSGERVPMLLLDKGEAVRLHYNLVKILQSTTFRGSKAVLIEKEFNHPSRLVCFENNQFIAT